VNPTPDIINKYTSQIVDAITAWAIKDALAGISNLMHSFGDATEPDFVALVPVYNRVLAISLLVLAAVVAFSIIERICGGQLGADLSFVPRVVVCVFFAYTGLSIVRYATVNAALLGHAWDKELSAANTSSLAASGNVDLSQVHLNVVALICMALLVSFLALVVYLELIVRAALVLTVTAFVPLVCVMAIWPRMAGGAVHLAEFLVGLLLSKFVVATAFVVGMSLLLPAVLGRAPNDGKADWMASGFAVLLITAVAPIALFQGIRFAHGTAGKVTRDLGAMALGVTPFGTLARLASLGATQAATRGKVRLSKSVGPALSQAMTRLRSRP
jgi:hypothetical protein